MVGDLVEADGEAALSEQLASGAHDAVPVALRVPAQAATPHGLVGGGGSRFHVSKRTPGRIDGINVTARTSDETDESYPLLTRLAESDRSYPVSDPT
ncbi:hypothetical protein GCM10009734_26250 [Nonomuraea bangladeshensis]